MTYTMKDGTIVRLPLTVDSIELSIKELKERGGDVHDFNGYKAQLYRDVLFCVRSGAAHSRALAEAALKLEDE